MSTCTAPHTLLLYRYRDGANYKVNGAVLLSGEASSEHHRRLLKA